MDFLTLIAKIDSEKAPDWVTLFKAGWGELADGVKFFVDKTAFDLVLAAIKKQGNEIVWDYEHQTLENVEAPAAGWIKELAWDDQTGISARVEWTEKAASYIEAKEYRYFSPVYLVKKIDHRVCLLHSVALTNTPKTKHLNPILAKLGSEIEENNMDREKLIKALGLAAGATDKDILAACAKLGIDIPGEKIVEKLVLPKEVVAALDLKDDDSTSTVVASIHALKQGANNSVSKADFDALKKNLTDRDADDAVMAAIAKGKITPDQKTWALDYAKGNLDGFNTFVAKAPQVVPVDKLPGKKETGDDVELNEATIQVAGLMGVSDDDLKKYGGEVTHG
ncbi:MAG: hypothetical protein JEZ12_24025 [Desulfobacterium sp.]|nr:hypothetical protein [Desulfobacterium sp.]